MGQKGVDPLGRRHLLTTAVAWVGLAHSLQHPLCSAIAEKNEQRVNLLVPAMVNWLMKQEMMHLQTHLQTHLQEIVAAKSMEAPAHRKKAIDALEGGRNDRYHLPIRERVKNNHG